MSDFVITANDIKRGKSYLPIMRKEAIVQKICADCIDAVQMAVKLGGGQQTAVPALFRPNYGRKQRFLLGILLKEYLNREFLPCEGTEYLMSADEYDAWGENHPIPTLERLKADKEIRDKIYDLLFDYKELEKRLTAAIYDECQGQNDTAIRTYAILKEELESIVTPEEMKNDIADIKKQYDEFFEKHSSETGEAE